MLNVKNRVRIYSENLEKKTMKKSRFTDQQIIAPVIFGKTVAEREAQRFVELLPTWCERAVKVCETLKD